MTTPFPDGLRNLFADPVPSSYADEVGPIREWVAMLEFVPQEASGFDVGEPFLLDDIEALLGHLRDWSPSGLWNPDRYAIQLQVPARSADEALHWAIAYHGDAARRFRMPVVVLVRVEVFPAEELERSWDSEELLDEEVRPVFGGVLCDEAYAATRELLTAATLPELARVLADFVTTIGAEVLAGSPGSHPDMIDVDITIDREHPRHAVAEAFSVVGLVVEQSLPDLLADARRVAARLTGVASDTP